MNLRSHSRSLSLAALALLAVLGASLPATAARADRVVLYPVAGRASEERAEAVEQRIVEVLGELGHRLIAPPSGGPGQRLPSTSAEMRAAAEARTAQYVVTAEMDPLRGQYRLHVMVYYAPAGRMEELVVTVLQAEEGERLADVVRSMVRPEGLGEDAVRLTAGEEPGGNETQTDPSQAEEEARRRQEEEARRLREEEERMAQLRAEEEERERLEAEEALRREEEERAQEERERREAEQRAFNERPQYGTDGEWMLQLGLGGGYVAAFDQARTGGGIGGFNARLGRTFEGLDGFEVRAGIDGIFGATNGVSIMAGAAYLHSPIAEPLYVGASAEIGAYLAVSGARDAAFIARISALLAYRITERLYLEASLPELGVITTGGGAFTISASVRASYRF